MRFRGVGMPPRIVAQADHESLRLQNEFYERSKHPLDTPQ